MVELNYLKEVKIIWDYSEGRRAKEGLKYLIMLKKNLINPISLQDQMSLTLFQSIINLGMDKLDENLALFPKIENNLSNYFMEFDFLQIKEITYKRLGKNQEVQSALKELEEKISNIKNKADTQNLTNSIDFKEREVIYYFLQGRNYVDIFGNIDQGIQSLQKGKDLLDKYPNESLLSDILQSLGLCYLFKGKLQLSINHFEQSLQIFEDLSKKIKCANCHINIGVAYTYMGNYDHAIKHYDQATPIFKVFEFNEGLGNVYESMIELFVVNNENDKARSLLKELEKLVTQSKENKFLQNLFLMAEGLVLKSSEGLAEKFKSGVNFLQILNDPMLPIWWKTDALFNLADISLLEMKLTQNEQTLDDIQSWLNQLLTIAQKQKSPSLLAQVYLLEGKLKILELKTNEAKDKFLKAHDQANQHGIKVLDQLIMQEYEQLVSQEQQWNTLSEKGGGSLINRIELSGLEKTFDELTRKRFDATDLSNMIQETIEPVIKDKNGKEVKSDKIMENFYKMIHNETYLTIFRQFTLGPEIFISDELKFAKTNKIMLETKLGVYFITAVGQGSNSNQGLFGPLPFPDHKDYVSMLYSCFMNDPENKDARAKGRSYCLFLLTFVKTFEPYYRNRQYLTEIFENFVSKFEKLQDVTKESLENLKLALIK